MSLPRVVVKLKGEFPQTVRRVLVDDVSVQVESIDVHRDARDIVRATLVIPCVYVEEYEE